MFSQGRNVHGQSQPHTAKAHLAAHTRHFPKNQKKNLNTALAVFFVQLPAHRQKSGAIKSCPKNRHFTSAQTLLTTILIYKIIRSILVCIYQTMETQQKPLPCLSPDNTSLARPRVNSAQILQGSNAVEIEHAGQRYLLRVTRENKLILTK